MPTLSDPPCRPVRRHGRRTPGLALAAAVTAGLALTACGGGSSSHDEAKKTGTQVAADSVAALKSAESVHVTGHTAATETDAESSLDLTFQGANTQGTVTQSGQTFQVILVGGKSYLKGDKAAYTALAGAAAAALIGDRWLLLTGTDASSLGNLTLASFAGSINTNTKYDAKVGTGSVNGTDALVLTDTTDNTKLYVAAQGKPYPLQAVKIAASDNRITFDNYNKKVVIVPPNNAIDLAQIEKSVAASASPTPSASPTHG